MLGIVNFPIFLLSCLVLNVTPGQDTMFIVGRSMSQGREAGVVSAMGIMSGVLVHTLLAALGLSLILAASSFAFGVVKFAGAVYLIWLGIGFFRRDEQERDAAGKKFHPVPRWILFRQGLLTNLLNPKVALFFLSFLPQFVSKDISSPFIPFTVLGLVLFTTGSIWSLFLAFGSSWLTNRFRHHRNSAGILKKCAGLLFIILGVRLAFSDPV